MLSIQVLHVIRIWLYSWSACNSVLDCCCECWKTTCNSSYCVVEVSLKSWWSIQKNTTTFSTGQQHTISLFHEFLYSLASVISLRDSSVPSFLFVSPASATQMSTEDRLPGGRDWGLKQWKINVWEDALSSALLAFTRDSWPFYSRWRVCIFVVNPSSSVISAPGILVTDIG